MKLHRILVVWGILVLASTVLAQSKRLAQVDTETINEEQVNAAAAAELSKLDSNRPQPEAAYNRAKLEILWRALDSLIDEKLFVLEAAKQQITKDQLIHNEIESNVETPSPEEVDAFYEANKAQIPIPKAQALPQVRQYMIDQSRRRYRNILVTGLRRSHKVVTYLDPLRWDVQTAGHPSRGPANAPVTIVEFADFECPYCGGLFPTLKAVERTYADKVRFVYRQFPLTNMHPHAQKAAEASLCANEQQKFWEFHDSMFGNQLALAVEDLKSRAVTMKLNTTAFNTCLDSGRQAAAVAKDQEEARKLGVSSTPTMFINGRLLSGNQPYGDIRAIIEDELSRAK
jgi:predicted DsbA family dithiol-disulfide isomerase